MTSGVKLTKRVVDQADPGRGRHYLCDNELRGFAVQVEPTGTKTYIVRYRPKGLGRDGPRRFVKLGRHGDLTVDMARELAKVVLGKVAAGGDPAADRVAERTDHVKRRDAVTIEELGQQYIREHAATHCRATTADNYEILFRLHINPVIGCLAAEQVSRAEVAKLHGAMVATPANANRVLATLCPFR